MKQSAVKENYIDGARRIVKQLGASRSNPKKLFPYAAVDSAIYSFYDPEEIKNAFGNSTFNLENYKPQFSVRLCPQKQEMLLRLLNTPAYFLWHTCNDNAPLAKVVFYSGGKESGLITFSCNHAHIEARPTNDFIKFGQLTDEGIEMLSAIKPWY
jgi:hypothetical protein